MWGRERSCPWTSNTFRFMMEHPYFQNPILGYYLVISTDFDTSFWFLSRYSFSCPFWVFATIFCGEQNRVSLTTFLKAFYHQILWLWLWVSFYPAELIKNFHWKGIVSLLLLSIIIINNKFILYISMNGLFFFCKMYRKGHPMERTTNALKSQWLKTEVHGFICYQNGRRAVNLCIFLTSRLLAGKNLLALINCFFNHILLRFVGKPTKENHCPSVLFSLFLCGILSLGQYDHQVLSSLKFYLSSFSRAVQPETRTPSHLSRTQALKAPCCWHVYRLLS